MKPFEKEILVGIEDAGNGETYPVILGSPRRIAQIDANEGDKIAIYRLIAVKRFVKNQRLE